MKEPNSTQILGQLAITPRPLDDYRKMFLITDAELTAGPILDCPAGASLFGAPVRAQSGTVISADPAYSTSPTEIVARARADVVRIAKWATDYPAQPDLPFPDDCFRLALSSHLFSVYPEYFDFDSHVTGLLELIRVTRERCACSPSSAQRPDRTRGWTSSGQS